MREKEIYMDTNNQTSPKISKLNRIKPHIERYETSYDYNKKYNVILSRFYLEHSLNPQSSHRRSIMFA